MPRHQQIYLLLRFPRMEIIRIFPRSSVVSSFVLPLAEVEKQESDDVDADRVDCVGRREGRRRYWRW